MRKYAFLCESLIQMLIICSAPFQARTGLVQSPTAVEIELQRLSGLHAEKFAVKAVLAPHHGSLPWSKARLGAKPDSSARVPI